jgi:hypothetical protein
MMRKPLFAWFDAWHLRNVCHAIGWSLVSIGIALVILAAVANARDLGQWDQTDPEIAAWYRSLKQPDNPDVSCCDEADAYWADSYEVSPTGQYIAIITDERDVPGRVVRPVGTRVLIPQHKLKFDQGNPTGHGIVFLAAPISEYEGRSSGAEETPFVYCYLSPGGV